MTSDETFIIQVLSKRSAPYPVNELLATTGLSAAAFNGAIAVLIRNDYVVGTAQTGFLLSDRIRAQIDGDATQGTEPFVESAKDKSANRTSAIPHWLPTAAFFIGVAAFTVVVAISVQIESPSPFLIVTLRTVTALAGAAFTMAVTGFISIQFTIPNSGSFVAGGPLAVFGVIFFFLPETGSLLDVDDKPKALTRLDAEVLLQQDRGNIQRCLSRHAGSQDAFGSSIVLLAFEFISEDSGVGVHLYAWAGMPPLEYSDSSLAEEGLSLRDGEDLFIGLVHSGPEARKFAHRNIKSNWSYVIDARNNHKPQKIFPLRYQGKLSERNPDLNLCVLTSVAKRVKEFAEIRGSKSLTHHFVTDSGVRLGLKTLCQLRPGGNASQGTCSRFLMYSDK